MRNTLEYPITKAEVVQFLQKELDNAQAKMEKELTCGDPTCIILQTAIEVILGSDLP